MSLNERTGIRDLTYSRWHRPKSIGRYLSKRKAALLKMVDLDCIEACHFCSQPLVLIETKDHRARSRNMTVTKTLAFMAGVPAYLVVYRPTPDGDDLAEFTVYDPFTNRDPQRYGPLDYAEWLWSFRDQHACAREGAA